MANQSNETIQLMHAIWILILLILISGVFALAEMALASSRRSRLQSMADQGSQGAKIALQIMENPSRLLAATQMGITVAALLMGIYGESAMSAFFINLLNQIAPSLAAWADLVSFSITIALVTAVSIILGEIVPKRLAIAQPEKVAAFCAPGMLLFIKVLSPAIAFLSWGADRVLSVLPIKAAPAVTSVEDILAYVNEGAKSGSIALEESHLLGNVLRLEDRRLATMMTPVSDIAWIDLHAPREENLRLLREAPHSRLPVCKGSLQQVIGLAESHDILQAALEGHIDFAEIPLQPALYVPASLSLADLLRTFRQQKKTFAFVVSEFGMTEGIISIDDVLLSVVGDMMPMADNEEDTLAVKRDDGSWLLDGLLPIDEMKTKLGIAHLLREDLGNFHTVGGFVLAFLGRIPRKAEKFEWANWTFEVVDIDRNRVDQVLASPKSSIQTLSSNP